MHGNTEDKITQVQWMWQNESSEYTIMVFSEMNGLFLHDTFLKDRVSFSKSSPLIDEASIIITDVKISDQGVYSCDYTTFPSGSHKGQTILTVLEGSPPVLSTVEAVGIVSAVVFIAVITAAVGYLFLRNRRRASSTILYYTTQSPSDLQQDVTYSDVTIRRPGKANRSTSSSGEIEYAAVSFSGRSESALLQANQLDLAFHLAELETVYAQVKKD
ncbi:nectin-1-like [Labeo rohita]|uniref:nectin-1-like n=1 Tax=Labeo rohita TaxID=84645 RepID=UPI0021E310FE|nr:nectin-1-like [Labeo rohita]